jgi:hypothetical protein
MPTFTNAQFVVLNKKKTEHHNYHKDKNNITCSSAIDYNKKTLEKGDA